MAHDRDADRTKLYCYHVSLGIQKLRECVIITYLRPQSEESVLKIQPRNSGDGHSRPHVGQVVGRPVQRTAHHDDRVSIADPGTPGPLQAEAVEPNDEGNTKRETEECRHILASNTPDLTGSDGAPEDSCREEGVDTGAEEAERRVRRADILDVDLILQNGDADEGRDESRDHLSPEGEARRNLEVVGELEICGE